MTIAPKHLMFIRKRLVFIRKRLVFIRKRLVFIRKRFLGETTIFQYFQLLNIQKNCLGSS